MADEEHKPRGASKDKFCGTAPYGVACETGQKFRENGKPSPWFFPFQAHHLLPVSCIQHKVVEEDDIDGVLRTTNWCINRKGNMLGMPIWGATVEWYTFQHRTLKTLTPAAPASANIPQHLVDHDLYSEEVNGKLTTLVSDWKTAGHKLEAKDIAGQLRNASSTMRRRLKKRGRGSHKAWLKAVKAYTSGGEYQEWYKPFSMADSPRPRPFPIRAKEGDDKILSVIKKIAEALSS